MPQLFGLNGIFILTVKTSVMVTFMQMVVFHLIKPKKEEFWKAANAQNNEPYSLSGT